MERWRNWSGAVRATPAVIHRPRSATEVCDAVAAARDAGQVLRVAGSGHSFAPIAASHDHMMTLADLPGHAVPAADGRTVTVGAGVTLRDLNRQLATAGLALPNMGDIDHQVIAGALATGTHGTGVAFGPMHTAVEGVEIVDGLGVRRWVDEDDLPAARLAVGSLGVVLRVRLSVVPAYRLATTVTKVALDDALADFDHHAADHRHAEFYWLPYTRWVQLKLADATDEAPLPVGVGQRFNDVVIENAAVWVAGQVARTFPGASSAVARAFAGGVSDVAARRPSHEAFASVRWVRFQEMEYALPRAALRPVLAALDALIISEQLPVALPVEVRVAAADLSAWLSPAWGRDSTYVAIHSFRGMPYTRYFRTAEQILLDHDGRPHWGKMHTLGAADLRPLYPRWEAFQRVRRRYDPDGTFVSPYLRRTLG